MTMLHLCREVWLKWRWDFLRGDFVDCMISVVIVVSVVRILKQFDEVAVIVSKLSLYSSLLEENKAGRSVMPSTSP